MTIDHALAVVSVSDFDRSHRWYEGFFNRPATNVPMPGQLAEWRVTNGGWLQMHRDPEHAGHSLFNLAVDDIARVHRPTGSECARVAQRLVSHG